MFALYRLTVIGKYILIWLNLLRFFGVKHYLFGFFPCLKSVADKKYSFLNLVTLSVILIGKQESIYCIFQTLLS